jgi:hypothetical protein
MTRTNTQTRTSDQRTFSSPVALAFVRTVMARRGLSEAQARKVYLDYLNRSQPADDREASLDRVMM